MQVIRYKFLSALVLLGLGFVLYGEVEFELGRQLVLRVEPVREVDTADAAIGVDLN